MRTRSGITIAWMAAAFVLFGAAFGFAATGKHTTGPSPKATSHVDANDNDQGSEAADEKAEKAEDASDTKTSESPNHERKQNHGFFVSQAAHCEDVPGFTAPANCKDDGKAHGEYVSSVAHSDLGKSNKGHAAGK